MEEKKTVFIQNYDLKIEIKRNKYGFLNFPFIQIRIQGAKSTDFISSLLLMVSNIFWELSGKNQAVDTER